MTDLARPMAEADVRLDPMQADDREALKRACAEDPDGSCEDGSTVDEGGHGTHVASTIASPVNGLGIEGVAPGAEIVNLRVGQDSGYFFLEPTLEALTYAPTAGVDVVNMSYYIDPWAFNCTANPADSPEEQAQLHSVLERLADNAARMNDK